MVEHTSSYEYLEYNNIMGLLTNDGDLDTRINTLAHWMFDAKHLVVFTGAGISTESGLPDFRG